MINFIHTVTSICLIAGFVLLKKITLPKISLGKTFLLFCFMFFWYFLSFLGSDKTVITAYITQLLLFIIWSSWAIFVIRTKNGKSTYVNLHSSPSDNFSFAHATKENPDLFRATETHASNSTHLGKLAAGVAHEINNPLGVIMGYIHLLDKRADTLSPADIRANLAKQFTAAERIAKIVSRVREFASPSPSGAKSTSVVQCLKSVIELTATRLKEENIQLEQNYSCANEERAFVNSLQLEQIFLNILINALEAVTSVDPKVIEIEVGTTANIIKVRIGDNGCGISKEISDRIFDPFFSTKPAGDNLGIGLSVVDSVARSIGAKVYFENRLAGGTNFFVEILRT